MNNGEGAKYTIANDAKTLLAELLGARQDIIELLEAEHEFAPEVEASLRAQAAILHGLAVPLVLKMSQASRVVVPKSVIEGVRR